jgi:hypothetical protein
MTTASGKWIVRVLCVGIATLAVASCQRFDPVYLSNTGDVPLRVRYVLPKHVFEEGKPPVCPRTDPIQMVATLDALSRGTGGSVPVTDYKMDMEECEGSFTLPPDFSAILFVKGFCDDYAEYLARYSTLAPDQWKPSLVSLSVDNGSSRVEWRGWDAVKQFRRARDGQCFYRFPA